MQKLFFHLDDFGVHQISDLNNFELHQMFDFSFFGLHLSSDLVQILIYLRASRMTKQAQSKSILAIVPSAGIVLTSVAATDFSSHGSCRFCWFHQFQFH